MYEMKRTKSALNTQQSLVRRAVCRFHIHDLVILYHQIILTAGSTVGTGRQNLFHLADLVLFTVFGYQCSGRTYCRAVTAGLAVCLLPVRSERSIDQRSRTDLAVMQGAVTGHLVTGADTSLTIDAQLRIIRQKRILFFRFKFGCTSGIAGFRNAVFIGQILQSAVAGFATGEASDIMIGKQHVQYLLSAVHHSLGMSVHHHSLFYFCIAGGYQMSAAFYFNHAHLAGSYLIDILQVAECGNLDVRLLCSFQYG